MSERTHRHELEKNVLADWIGEKLEVVRPYGVHVAVGGLILLAIVVGSIVYFSQSDSTGPRAWREVMTAYSESPQKIAEALERTYENPEVQGTKAELWARLAFADKKLERTAFQAAQGSNDAKTELSEAEKALQPIEERTNDPALLARCRYSLARIYETQNKLDKAREYYSKVAEASKDSALGKAAAEAASRLDPQGDLAQVIGWLAEQKPLPKKTPGAGDSFLDSFPGFGQPNPTLPERPNLSLPGSDSPLGVGGEGIDFGRDNPLGIKGQGTGESQPPRGDDPSASAPAEEKPAGESPKPETPAGDKPGDAKPSEPTKPGDEKPAAENAADEKPADR